MRRLTNAETKQAIAGQAAQQEQARAAAAKPIPQAFWEVCRPNLHGGEDLILVTGYFDEADACARSRCCRLYSFRLHVDGAYARRLEMEYWSAENTRSRWEGR